jgi:cyclase
MLKKRIIVCLDVKNGRTTKGVKFKENIDVGDPVTMARFYYQAGADELVFYDISASYERRKIMVDVVARVAESIFIPFTVGGGIASIGEMREVLLAGAEKVSVNSQAVRNPSIIEEGASLFGRQCLVLGMDVLKDTSFPSGYRVVIDGGREPTSLDALSWAKQAEKLGAGEIVLNSIDADGMQQGYELAVTKMISVEVGIPVVASGGAGKIEHILAVFEKAHADAALIASMVHFGTYTIAQIKSYLHSKHIPVRMDY